MSNSCWFGCILLLLLAGNAGGMERREVPPPAAPVSELRLAVLGDSLTAGYGLPRQQAFPAQLQAALRKRGWAVTVLDHGVSGDTTAGGRNRLAWMLQDRPHAVLVELGANDTLRGFSPAQVEHNLEAILTELRGRGVSVLLAGMVAPDNYGTEYKERFDAVYPRLAERHQVPLWPFFLDGVAGVTELNQGDGIHPNARGVAEIVRRLLPAVEAVLAPLQPRPHGGR